MMRFVLVALAVVGAVYCTPVEKAKRQAGDFEFLPINNPMIPMSDDRMDGENARFIPQDFFRQFADLSNLLRAWFNRPFFQPDDFDDDIDEDFGRLPPNYDNSTFSTKVVNGSVITVNETIKKHESNDSSFVWHVKVVQIRPENGTISHDIPIVDEDVETNTESVQTLPSGEDSENDVSSVPKVRRSPSAAKLR